MTVDTKKDCHIGLDAAQDLQVLHAALALLWCTVELQLRLEVEINFFWTSDPVPGGVDNTVFIPIHLKYYCL
jgi:hypothetical protein